MGYRVLGQKTDIYQGYESRLGLEGPFAYPNGRILYYDPKEGQYWDPKTDFFVDSHEVAELQQMFLAVLSK
jgi:hypothetical protein